MNQTDRCEIYFAKVNSFLLQYCTEETLGHYMLVNLLCSFGVYFVIENLFNQTLYVTSFTNIDSGLL